MAALAFPSLTNSQLSARRRHGSGLLATLRHWQRRNRERAALAQLTRRELADFGASTADVYRELRTPFWRD